MKVFISWSGDISHKVALVFKDWLPLVIQSIEPYVSSEDIDKGARWSSDISRALDESAFGILCITKDNINAPWINFEAGALSKSFEESRIAPFLFGLSSAEVKGPLVQFQAATFEKNEMIKLMSSINKASGEAALEEERLNRMLNLLWPQFEAALKGIDPAGGSQAGEHKRKKSSTDELVEEILLLVRNQQKILTNPESIIPRDYIEYLIREIGRESRVQRVVGDKLDCYYMLFSKGLSKHINLMRNSHPELCQELDGLETSFRRLSIELEVLLINEQNFKKNYKKWLEPVGRDCIQEK